MRKGKSRKQIRIITILSVITITILAVLAGCFGDLTDLIGADVLAKLGSTMLEVSVDSIKIDGAGGVYTFPGVTLIDGDGGSGVTNQIEFTITNTGDLDLSSIILGSLSGQHAGDFDLDTTDLSTALAPGTSTSFSIRFDPIEDAGTLTADVTIASRETDNVTFTINAIADWWGIKTIQESSNVGTYTSIAVDSTDVYIAYLEESDGDPWNYDAENLYVTVSANEGQAWSPITIDKSVDEASLYPSITAVDGTAYLSYLQMENDGLNKLKFRKTSNRGLTWSDVLTVVDHIDQSHSYGWHSDIKAVGNTVYIAYFDDTPYTYDEKLLAFVRSDDGGETFAGVTNTSDDFTMEYVDWDDEPGDPEFPDPVGMYPSMAVSGDRVYISYFVYGIATFPSDEVRVAVSVDNGETWDTEDPTNPAIKNIVDYPEYDPWSSVTDISVNGSSVYLIYTDDSTERIMFARSDDGGDTWPAGNVKTIDSSTDVKWSAGMAASGSTVYVAYYDLTDDNWNLMFTKSTDGGSTWPATGITIDDTADVGMCLDIAVAGESVYISYYNWDSGDLKFAKSIDGGVTW